LPFPLVASVVSEPSVILFVFGPTIVTRVNETSVVGISPVEARMAVSDGINPELGTDSAGANAEEDPTGVERDEDPVKSSEIC